MLNKLSFYNNNKLNDISTYNVFEFYSDTVNYIAGESAHDDNADALSGVSEFVNQQNRNHYSKDIYDRGYGTKTVDFSEYYDRYRLKNVF